MDENTTKNLRFQMPNKVTEMNIAHALTAIFVTAAAVAAILFLRKVLTTINAALSTVDRRLRPPLPHHRLQLRMTVECEQGKFCLCLTSISAGRRMISLVQKKVQTSITLHKIGSFQKPKTILTKNISKKQY